MREDAVEHEVRSVARFWALVSKGVECWLWLAHRSATGYGKYVIGGRTRRAHRIAWELTKGPIPDGMCVCHRCDNPPCVNPDHLFLGSHLDNMRDKVKKGRSRSASGEQNRHASLTNADVIEMRRLHASGVRSCKLARQFRVSPTNVCLIVHRKAWRHIP